MMITHVFTYYFHICFRSVFVNMFSGQLTAAEDRKICFHTLTNTNFIFLKDFA